MMIPSTDPQVRGGLGLGTRQCARPGTKSRGRPLGVGRLSPGSLGAGTMVLWGAATMGAAASPSEASQPTVARHSVDVSFRSRLGSGDRLPKTPCGLSGLCLCALARLPALQLTHVPKPSAPVGYNYRYRYNSHPERPFMVMFMLGSACCATHLRALSNN